MGQDVLTELLVYHSHLNLDIDGNSKSRSTFDKSEIENILRKSGGTTNLPFGGLNPTPFSQSNLWKNVLEYVKSKDENHHLHDHIRIQR